MAIFDLEKFSKLLINTVNATLADAPKITVTGEPEVAEREIIEYDSRMRVLGLEKFNGPCYTAAVNYYRSPEDLEQKKSIGAMIIFLEESSALKFLNALGHKGFDESEDDIILEKLGEVTNQMADTYKKELSKNGYRSLELSAPVTHKSDLPQGIEFDYDQLKYCEVSFNFWKEKTLIVATTMAPA